MHDMGYRACGLIGMDALKASLPGGGNDCSIPYDDEFVKRLDQEQDQLDPKEKRANRIIRNYFVTKLAADRRAGRDKKQNPVARREEDAEQGKRNWLDFAKWFHQQTPPFA